jgi:hypothetical protein
VAEVISARRHGLRLTQRTGMTMISTNSEVPFTVQNTLPVAARVRVRVTSDDNRCLQAETSQVHTVPARGSAQIPVTMRALGNCEVQMRATLVGAGDQEVSTEPTPFPATVRWRFEDTVMIVGMAGLAVVFVIALVRTVRRGQSQRRGARVTSDPVYLAVLGGETPAHGMLLATPAGPSDRADDDAVGAGDQDAHQREDHP